MASSDALGILADDVVVAARGNNQQAFYEAGQRLADACHEATREALDSAVTALAPALTDAPRSLGGALAQYVSSLIGMDGDFSPVLDSLVENACGALEGTRLFISLYKELVGPVPDRAECGEREFERFVSAAASRVDDAGALAREWMYAESWVQPVLFLAQRIDFRRALPQRERLTAAAVAAQDDLPDLAPWLLGLLRVLDDEPVVGLHRPTGAGFRTTISGVADNFQLHTVLAANIIPLLPTPRRSLFRRKVTAGPPEAPTPAMVAAADGSGDATPVDGIIGQFNLVDGNGDWIWNEGRPDEIPSIDGVRVVVLDPSPYERSWNAGRAYPLLRAHLDVVPLSLDEAASWLSRVRPAKAPTDAGALSQGVAWTDDMSVALPPGRAISDLVTYTVTLSERGRSGLELETAVAREFSLSDDDAALAVDRVFGGITRAATRNEANRPDPVKDPVAFESYRQAMERSDP